MASSTKKSWKLQEFVAHGNNVGCLALGHKSGRVMVTGGDDRKVNLWALGKPNCIMSLSGHTTPVECVRFGNQEEIVIAGSMSGVLKIWDLEKAKILRTLSGHTANIRSLDIHPFGNYVASGGMDNNIKLWDIGRKGTLFTYKGHRKCINDIKFSPDGRWLVSASEDGNIKLWDLTAGKMLKELTLHTGPVNCVEFHPNEFLLASGSSDRTVKFWDLETFQLVSTSDGDCGPIRTIFFHPDGLCLYAGTQDALKVYGWEPTQCLDSLLTGWGKIANTACAQSTSHSQLIGASFSQTIVSTYVVDLQQLAPIASTPSPQSPPPLAHHSGRRSFVTERPPTQSSNQANVPKSEPDDSSPTPDDPGDDLSSEADIKEPADYQEIFQPKKTLSHSPSPGRKNLMEPFIAPPDDDNDMPKPVVVKPSVPPAANPARNSQNSSESQLSAKQTHKVIPQPRDPDPPVVKPVVKEQQKAPPVNEMQGLDINAFLPKEEVNNVRGGGDSVSEDSAVSSLSQGHSPMLAVLTNRNRNLQIVRAMFSSGNTKAALESAINMGDQAIVVDVCNILVKSSQLWNLDICIVVLSQLSSLLSSKYETYVQTGCSCLRLILKNFSSVIKSNVVAPPSMGVDLSREERYNKCKAAYGHLMELRPLIASKQQSSGKVGSKFRELHLLMKMLD